MNWLEFAVLLALIVATSGIFYLIVAVIIAHGDE